MRSKNKRYRVRVEEWDRASGRKKGVRMLKRIVCWVRGHDLDRESIYSVLRCRRCGKWKIKKGLQRK